MACPACTSLEGHSTTFFSTFTQVFAQVDDGGSTSLTETGTARCRTCGQLIIYDYDEMLIPKLRVQFVKPA